MWAVLSTVGVARVANGSSSFGVLQCCLLVFPCYSPKGDFPNLSSVLVVHCATSVVSSGVIIAHIMWTRRRFESQVIVTHSHRLESFCRQFCVGYVVHPA